MSAGIGRSDLARVVLKNDGGSEARASILGYRRAPGPGTSDEGRGRITDPPPKPPRPRQIVNNALQPVSLLLPVGYSLRQQDEPAEPRRRSLDDGTPDPKLLTWSTAPTKAPDRIPIGPEERTAMLIERLLLSHARSGGPDVPAAVREISIGKIIETVPRRQRRVAPERIQLLVETRPDAIIPFRFDFRTVIDALRRLLPRTHINPVTVSGRENDDETQALANYLAAHEMPVLAATDFGHASTGFWHALGRKLALKGTPALALAPCPTPAARAVSKVWKTTFLSDAIPASSDRKTAEHLLVRLAHADQIPPALVRSMRLEFYPKSSPRIEVMVWARSEIKEPHPEGATFDPAIVPGLQTKFAQLDLDTRRRADAVLRAHKAGMADEIRFKEVASYGDQASEIVSAQDLSETQAFFEDTAARLSTGAASGIPGLEAWLSDFAVSHGSCEGMWVDQHLARSVSALTTQSFAADPANLKGRYEGSIAVALRGRNLTLEGAYTQTNGSNAALIETGNGHVEIVPLVDGPAWADRTGRDAYGDWAEIAVEGVVQRLRRIPRGSFLIGSHKDEPERYEDEGPQTEITFAQDFWMFDTVVTVAFWHAVMSGDTPETGQEEHPKTDVSWNDTKGFIDRLNAARPGLALHLPSEAQWEYACRAETASPYFFGVDAREEEIHFDSSDGTIPVTGKPPNKWGLYQMHGNVWEWCADIWAESHGRIDPTGAPRTVSQQETDQFRVVRGGSWYDTARGVRSAFRGRSGPEYRDDYLGFRCAQFSQEPARGAGQDDRPSARAGDPRGRRHGRVSAMGGDCLELPSGPFVLRTDRAELEFNRVTQSDLGWATALGRDRHGLWARLDLRGVETPLRWIPPGQFTIGSPKDDPGYASLAEEYDFYKSAEEPQTDITIATGFWLMDAPVTQALWSAIMGENPSKYQTNDRPVDSVSWNDAQAFIDAVNGDLIQGGNRRDPVRLRLPSEAEWEYACRAGTRSHTFAGDIEIQGERNAPVLDEIAWYGGNSGVEFDLDEGFDSSGWKEKQYPHEKAGTRPVRLKRPNPWGCYDMLGNVFEWCDDVWMGSHAGIDPTGAPRLVSKQETDPPRIFRGGSWVGPAHYLRSASRNWDEPQYRLDYLGFRCAASQSSQCG